MTAEGGIRATGFRWSIKRKLLTLGAGTFLPLLCLLAFWVWWEVHDQTEAAEATLTLASRQAGGHVEFLLAEATGHLRVLARNPAVQRRQVGQMENLLREVRRAHPEIENLSAFTADGRIVATAVPPPAAPVRVVDRPWFQRVMATGQPTVGGFQIGRITGEPIAVVAVPLGDADGPPNGVLAAALSLRRLRTLLHALPLASGMTVAVMDEEGQVLAHAPKAEGWVGRRLPSAGGLPAGPAVVRKLAWFEGGDRVAAIAMVQGTAWRVLVGVPRASLEARVWKGVWVIALPLLALLALSSLIGLLIAVRVWRPLRALTEAAKRLPGQVERLSVQVASTDEVGELARAFSAMAAQVAEVRSSLERRVEELTALFESGRLLTESLELPQVLQRLTEIARSRLGVDVVLIWLRDEAAESIVLQAHAGVTRPDANFGTRLALEEGLAAWWIMRHRVPLVVADVLTEPRLKNRGWMQAEGIVSFLGVPLLLGDVAVGILTCLSRERRGFSSEEVSLAQALATQAAVAIENARLHGETRARTQKLEERTAQLELLHLAARVMSSEHDLERLLQRLVETARELLGAGYGALAVFEHTGPIRQFFTAGLTPEARERIGPLPEGRGLLGHVFTHEQALRLADLTVHPAAVGFPPGHPPMRSLLAMPIRFRGKILGALYLTEKPAGFTAEDEALLTTLCADAAVAIENAQLVKDLQQSLNDLKATQEQLVRGEALRAVGELASGTAHHLNNILAVIGGRTELLLQTIREPSLRRSLEIVAQAVKKGAKVLRRVREFSQVQPVSQAGPVDLNRVIREALELTRPRWQDYSQAQGIAIEARLESGQIPAVLGDRALLTEVLVNVLLNAVDALPNRGRITVRTWASGERVHCSVTDTGAGMSEEVRRRVLDPFFTTKGPKSAGLGLSVAYGVLQRHGGGFAIESSEGKGTTVTITLPVAAAAVAEPAPATPMSPARILVIDDEAEVRETLAEALASRGHLVSQVASGAEGVSLFEAERHDLVFTDLGMPGMTGWQVAERIKAISPTTPVVLVSGWSEDLGGAGAPGGCVDQIISKPFELDMLAAVIQKTRAGRTE